MVIFVAMVCALLGGMVLGIFLGASAGRNDERRRWEQFLLQRAAGDPPRARAGSPATAAESAPQSSELRQQRLEDAVDAIALEVERIAEGQRFVTRLLADGRSKAAVSPNN